MGILAMGVSCERGTGPTSVDDEHPSFAAPGAHIPSENGVPRAWRGGLGGKKGSGLPGDDCTPDLVDNSYSVTSTNPYFPIVVGTQWSYEDTRSGALRSVLITVLNETRVIEGVETRVVERREWEGDQDELARVSWDYFAQQEENGTICQFGKDVDVYINDIVSHEGAWCASDNGEGARFMLPDPQVGTSYSPLGGPDMGDTFAILGSGTVSVPFGRFTNTLRVKEFEFESKKRSTVRIFASEFGLISEGSLSLVEFRENASAPAPPVPTPHQGSCALGS